jgi:ubiquinone/menaquinone biosynthesis C-methylase UbiE
MSNFFDEKLTISNLDNFHIRKTIFNAIKNNLTKFHGNLLDVGCGQMPYRGYILENSNVDNYVGLDIETAIIYDKKIQPDVKWNGKKMPFDDEIFDVIFMTEVLEHVYTPKQLLKECCRVLKKDGIIFFTVPFVWPLHETPHDEFRYTPYALEKLLKESGFKNISIVACGGWSASLAQMIGLFVRRSPMKKYLRNFLSILMLPIVKFLLYKDKKDDKVIGENKIFTNFYGTAKK